MNKFSDLQVVREYQHKDKSKLIKYIEILYSKTSELNKIDNLTERKKEACKRSGIAYDEDADYITLKKDSTISHLIYCYLSYFCHSNKHHSLMANQQLFWRMQRVIMEFIDGGNLDEAIKMSEKSEALLSRIQRQLSELYGSSDLIEMAETEMRKGIIMRSPEERVRKTA